MIQRRTQSADYWLEQLELTREDISHLYSLILDEGRPLSTAVLARAVIGRRCRHEEKLISAELSKGPVYQPKKSYSIGQEVLFPVFDYALGSVVGTRGGKNPEYGEFTVIQVEFDQGEVREFASGLTGEHKLNQSEADAVNTELQATPEELYELYGVSVEERLKIGLREHDEFVAFRGDWFLKDLLLEIEEGHLNIAEALIEIKGMPLATKELVGDLDLPEEVSAQIQALALSSALESDARFDNVGDAGRDIWYLARLTPQQVLVAPERLVIEQMPYDRTDIAQELLLIEREIDDEGSGEDAMGPSRPIYRTSIALTYPHWRCGTLPLTVRTRGLFPQATDHHTPVILIDGQSGDKMQGWVVQGEGFVFGLTDWYSRYDIPVGAYLKVERTRDPRVISIDFEARRLKRLWSKVAVVRDGELAFELEKLPVACEYDEQLSLGEASPDAIDFLWEKSQDRGDSLLEVMISVSLGLVELSPQRTFHAKTLYSGVNLLKRVPPAPIFAVLSSESCFVPMGGGYWAIDEALI